MSANRFSDVVLLTAPRILGLMDRDPESTTYGCCERYYWHYKLHDFANARFQEITNLLALLYSYAFNGNIYHGNKQILNWSLAAAAYWTKIQYSDGSVAELYPYERSFCATAFSTLAVCEALLELLETDECETVRRYLQTNRLSVALERAAGFLCRNVGFKVANQAAAAATAIHCVGVLAGRKELEQEASQIASEVLRIQCEQGFFSEYGGFDLGYSTITAGVLATYQARGGKAPGVASALADVAAKAREHIDDHGNYGCAFMSRNTSYIFSHGLTSHGRDVLVRIEAGLAANSVVSPLWMDDRYCIGLALDYLKTHIALGADLATPVGVSA